MFGRKRKKKKLAGSAKPLRNDGETEATDSTTAREQKRGSRKSTALHKQPPMTIRQKLEAFFGSRKRDLPSFLEEKGHLVSPSSSPSVSDVGRVSPVASTVPPPQQSVPPVVPQSPPPAIVARNSLSPVICRPSPIHPPVQDDELRAEVPPPPEDPSACSVPPPLPHRDEDAEVAVVISNDAKANCDGEGHSSRADDLFPPQRPSPRSLPEPDIDSATRFEGDTPPPRHDDDDDDEETPPTPPARSPSPRPTAVDSRVPLCAEDSPPPLSSRSAESDGDGDDDDKEPLPPSTSMRGHDELPPLPLPRDVPEPGLERALLPWPCSLSSRSPQPDGGVRGMSPDTRESVLEPYETDDDRRLTESKALSDEALPCTMSSSPPPDERDRPAETVALPLQENDEAVSIAAEMNEEETEVDERTVELTEEGRIAADVTPSAAAVAAEQADAATQETTERLVHNCLSAALATSTTSKPALNHLTRSRPMSASNRKRPTSSRRAKALGITVRCVRCYDVRDRTDGVRCSWVRKRRRS